uniref:ATP synthase complex subunit 8 n=1 Tax=Platyptilia sp. DM741 TaxID=2759133 RepID=A0A7L7S0N7_9NEOP|nr:ATP synthase F0 subunit 8 [Platyptilia sp. DM741]
MPQMMPINWILLFFFFIIIFIIFNMMNYYIFSIKFKSNKSKKLDNKMLVWKW